MDKRDQLIMAMTHPWKAWSSIGADCCSCELVSKQPADEMVNLESLPMQMRLAKASNGLKTGAKRLKERIA